MAHIIEQAAGFSAIGRSTLRIDGIEKVTGQTRYAGDLSFPGLLHARLVLSPYAHARIVSIDTSEALATPGVVAVYTAQTLKMALEDSSERKYAPLARNEVFWCGHPVAVVLGETEAAAEDGVHAVDVDYEPLPVVIHPLIALQPDAPLTRPRRQDEASEIAGGGAHADVGGGKQAEDDNEELSENVSKKVHQRNGDVYSALRVAAVVVERSYRTHSVHQSYVEPQSITVVPHPSGKQMTVYASSQGLYEVRSGIATALDLPEHLIHVESVPIGGAFGGKSA